MSDFRKELKSAEEKATQWEEQISTSLSNLGQLLIKKKKSDPSFTEPIEELQKKLEKNTEQKEQLEKIQKALEDLNKTRKLQKEQLKELEEEKEILFTEIGQEAYRLHKHKAWEEPSYKPVFEKLTRLEDKILEAENELYRLRSTVNSGSILNKIKSTFKTKARQSSKKNAGENMDKQYRKVAELLFAFNSFEPLLQEHLPELYKRYIQHSKRSEKYEENMESLGTEETKLLDKAGDNAKNLSKAIRQINDNNEILEEELDVQFITLGQDFWTNDKIPADWTKELDAHKQLLEQQEHNRIKIEKIHHQMELEKMTGERQGWEKKREQKEKQMQQLTGELEGIRSTLKEMDGKIKSKENKIKSLSKKIPEKESL